MHAFSRWRPCGKGFRMMLPVRRESERIAASNGKLIEYDGKNENGHSRNNS
ncbi:hypothetical protein [Burkholderia territorii]|uniref:hypothetical protein n=1 Tax=Burkholderia territorii TaxID=1503055 RepID=UPI000AEEE345|nr:hypothetical protein [Burkholderia territorii]